MLRSLDKLLTPLQVLHTGCSLQYMSKLTRLKSRLWIVILLKIVIVHPLLAQIIYPQTI